MKFVLFCVANISCYSITYREYGWMVTGFCAGSIIFVERLKNANKTSGVYYTWIK